MNEKASIKFKNKLKYLALLNAIIEPEWEYRYYSYNSKWGPGEEMASLRDGCGGEWFILFFEDKVAFKCTSPADGLYSNFEDLKNTVSSGYETFLTEPAFSMDIGSCIWYLNNNSWVKLGNKIDDLPTPETIQKMTADDFGKFAGEMYEQEIDTTLIQKVFEGKFSIDIARAINPEINIDVLNSELEEIGIGT